MREHASPWRSRGGLLLCCLLIVAGSFLLSERTQVLGVITYLLLLACPLMHLTMHRGHDRDERSERP